MIKNVKVVDWCISCRNCENVCPKIFKVTKTSQVISNNFVWNETEILMAEAMCPVNVIKVEKKWDVSLKFKESKVISKKYLTKDIVELILSKPKDFSYKAGQYVSIMFEDWKGKFSRQYSVAEVTDETFSLTIRLLEKWRWASKIKKMKVGQKVKFLWALWGFYLQNTQKEKYFISTGTGLAPFIAMAQNTDPEVKKYFIIGARKKEDFYYEEKIKNFPNSEVHYYVSQEEAEWCKKWRVTDHLPLIPKDAEIYICGNPEMVHWVLDYTSKNAYENVYSEDFTVSGKYEPIWKEIFVNGNIPFLKEISWAIITLWFALSAVFLYRIANDISLFKEFLFFGKFQNFIFNLSWFSAFFVMIIRPLSDMFSKNNFLRKLKNLRKPLGILASLLIIINLTWKWFFDLSQIISYFTTVWRWNTPMALITRTSEITAFILLITSNTFSQKFLGKWWKKIQYLSYPFFITGAIAGANYWQDIVSYVQYYGALVIWIILWIIAFVKNKK